jgi:hypothetical protein
MNNSKCIRCINLIDQSILDYNEDTGLGSASLRMTIYDIDVVDEILFNDKNVKKIEIEVQLKSGHLSVSDLIDAVYDIRCEYQLFRGELELFEVYEEDYVNKKFIYVEPFLGT